MAYGAATPSCVLIKALKKEVNLGLPSCAVHMVVWELLAPWKNARTSQLYGHSHVFHSPDAVASVGIQM